MDVLEDLRVHDGLANGPALVATNNLKDPV